MQDSRTVTAHEIREQVKAFIIDAFFLDTDRFTLHDDTSFLDEGVVDSTGILEVINFLQSTYQIEIRDSEMLPENLDSLNNIAAFVMRKIDETRV